jgi:predicted phosphodiesterase
VPTNEEKEPEKPKDEEIKPTTEPIVEEPEPQEPKSELLYKVGLMSDMHYDVADSKKSEYAEDITNALNYFKQQGVDFIASCGDFAQYDFKDFDGFYKLYMKNVPDIRLYTCLGNHDYLLMYDEHNTMSESDRQMAWQNTIADLHCRTDVKDRKSSEAENDIHFFEYDAPWDAPKGTGTRNIKSKLNYWIERHGDIYVFLSVDYGKDPIPQLWGTMANAVNLLDKSDKYVKQMKEYVKDTPYNEKLEGKFDYQFYHPNTMIWLKDIIEANKDKNIFVFTHHYLTHKAGGSTPSNGKWFYSQMRVWPYTSDERIRQRYYSGANTLCGIEFHFINKLNNLYKNVTWFSGHTHIKWDNIKYDEYLAFCDKEFDIVKPDGKETVPLVDDIWQYANGKYDYRRYTRKSENPTGDCGMNVHLPSLSKPIDITTGHGTTIYGASEGAIMEVWNDKVVISGITFKSSGSKYESTVVCSKALPCSIRLL